MNTVELLSAAIELAKQLGYQVREDQLEGAGGGHCLIQGQKWLLLDLTQTNREQLGDVIDALRQEPGLAECDIAPALTDQLGLQSAG
jgi:Spy/CpxP family protein refolding chaperone